MPFASKLIYILAVGAMKKIYYERFPQKAKENSRRWKDKTAVADAVLEYLDEALTSLLLYCTTTAS